VEGMRAEQHGTKKPRTHILQATATLRLMLEQSADHMPHKTRTLENGENVVSKWLPSAWRWKDTLLELNIVNEQFGLKLVSTTEVD
jgi:hypothetical protein